MDKIRTKQTVKHSATCSAMVQVSQGYWSSPWYFPNGFRDVKGTIRRDCRGYNTRGFGEQWLVFRCNCEPCPAELLVALNDVFNIVPWGLAQANTEEKHDDD